MKTKTTIFETFQSHELTNEEYHGMAEHYSSSQLKDILDDPEIFYRKYITREIEREESSAFDVGTYFHTSILEPDKVEDELAVFKGVRRGKEWEFFKAKNFGKTIITENEETQANKMIESVKANKMWAELSRGAMPEYSLATTVKVATQLGMVYLPDGRYLTLDGGWTAPGTMINFKKSVNLNLRVRADSINWERGIILDLKSTSGNAKSVHYIKDRISSYKYDMSAMLYADLFGAAFHRDFDFYWVFASKDTGISQIYRADQDSKMVGRAKWVKAVLALAECIENNWKFQDTVVDIGPTPWDRDLIKKKEDIL